MIRQLFAFLLITAITAFGGCAKPPQKNQDMAIDHYVLSQILAEQGELDAALSELAEAIKQDPTLSVAYAATGDIHRKRGSYGLAEKFYKESCETNPYAFRPHYNLGVTYQMLAEAAKTIEQMQEYLSQAVDVYLKAITLKPGDFDSHLNVSACYYELGETDLAEKYCKAAIEINPKNPQAWSNLGIIYEGREQLAEAVKAYKSSLELQTDQPQLLLSLGAIYMRQGRPQSAMEVFKIAAEQTPEDSAVWEQIGVCHYSKAEYDSAQKAYEKAIELNKDNPAAHRGLGVVYMTQFLLEPQKIDLRDKALTEWNASLYLQPEQQDLIKLVKKYSPTSRSYYRPITVDDSSPPTAGQW